MRELPLSLFCSMIAAAALISFIMAPLSQPAFADDTNPAAITKTTANKLRFLNSNSPPKFLRPQRTLGSQDEIAALEAIHRGLSEAADGETYVWRSRRGRLNAILQPTTSFLDKHQRVCRHVVILLNSGFKSQRAEGIACRTESGSWSLAG